MAASFNASGAGGLTAVVPTTSGFLTVAAVTTSWFEEVRRRLVTPLAGVSGAQSMFGGKEPVAAQWLLQVEAPSMVALTGFKTLLESYRGAGRFTLVDEFDYSRDYVELVSVQLVSRARPVGTTAVVADLLVKFEVMQP